MSIAVAPEMESALAIIPGSHGLAGSAAGDPDSGPEGEIAALQRLLDERDQALLRAAISVTELQFELEASKEEAQTLKGEAEHWKSQLRPLGAAPPKSEHDSVANVIKVDNRDARNSGESESEVDKVKREWHKTQKMLERSQAERKADQARMRSQLHESEHQRLMENRARRMESAHASAKISNLQKAVETANARAVAAEISFGESSRPNVKLASASAAAAAILAALTTWVSMPHTSAPAASKAGSSLSRAVVAVQPATPVAAPNPTAGLGMTPPTGASTVMVAAPLSTVEQKQGFQSSLSRLNRILTAFPNRKPEQLLREVHLAYAATDPTVCSFEWNHGQPAVIYSGEGNKLSLGETLSKCAQALEKQVHK